MKLSLLKFYLSVKIVFTASVLFDILLFLFRPFVFGCFSFFFFLFSTQNRVPQIIIGMARVIYQIKGLSVVIRTKLKRCQKFFSVSRKTGLNFLIFEFFEIGLIKLSFFAKFKP